MLQENHARIGNQNYARFVTKKNSSQLHEEAFHDNFYLDLKFSVAFLREKSVTGRLENLNFFRGDFSKVKLG